VSSNTDQSAGRQDGGVAMVKIGIVGLGFMGMIHYPQE
jgi:hypothetical protein